MSKLGIGVLGWAHGHVGSYAGLIKDFDDAQLIMAWDHDQARGQRSAEQFGGGYSPDPSDVLDNPDIQLVIIGAETNRHPDLCVAAANAGKDIILQKPMALSSEACDDIIAAVEKNGVFFSLAFQMRYDPCNLKMKQMCDDGKLGKVGIVRRRHCLNLLFNEAFATGPSSWHIDPVQNMGMFMDDASHATDWLYWMLGEPVSVMAEIDNVLSTCAPDDTGLALYRFKNGEFGYVLNSSVVWASESTSEIYGDQGVLIENYGDGPSTAILPPNPIHLKYYDANNKDAGWQDLQQTIPPGHGWRIQNVIRNILDEYKQGKIQVSARDGKISTEMILGAYQSATEGCRVALPLT
ncbi:MAG: Gfo/Idh/MocA family oxidoreductase [Armatimonadia bacterium]